VAVCHWTRGGAVRLVVVLWALKQPDRPAPDMPVLARIQVDEGALGPPATGEIFEPPRLVRGQGELHIHTCSKSARTLLFLMIEITLTALLYAFGQLRALMRFVLERRLVLAEVFRQASALEADQSLTV